MITPQTIHRHTDVLCAVQPSAIGQASKCGSLMHVLHGAGPAVITSSFPDILDICAALLSPRSVRFVQIDVHSSAEAAARAVADFASGRASVVLLQQQAALQHPELDLSRADLCVFYDSGISRAVRSPLCTTANFPCMLSVHLSAYTPPNGLAAAL